MASSSSDHDENNSSDDEQTSSVFFDAIDHLNNNNETSSSSQEQPRWRLSSRGDSIQQQQRPEHPWTISLTDEQIRDIQMRDKLQKLRFQEKPKVKQSSSTEDLSHSFPVKNPLRDQQKDSFVSLSNEILSNDHQQSATLPLKSSHRTTEQHSNEQTHSSSNELNMIDLMTIDRITKYGEITADSRKLDDEEILHQPIVFNRDTGKYVPLSDANPMIQTILERVHGNNTVLPVLSTSIFHSTMNILKSSSEVTKSDPNLSRQKRRDDDDDDSLSSSDASSTKSGQTTGTSTLSDNAIKSSTSTEPTSSRKKHLSKLAAMNFFRRKKKTIDEPQQVNHADDDDDEYEKGLINDGLYGDLKYKASRHLKEAPQFDKTHLLQTIVDAHEGPIWCMRFSPDGQLLATGGQDCLLKVWVLKSAQIDSEDFSRLTSISQKEILCKNFHEFYQRGHSELSPSTINSRLDFHDMQSPFFNKPFCKLLGHQAPVLDVAWSKSLFLLSSSMDKTVRLWHLSRSECLCFFRHIDFVSAIAFHPRDDRYFVSGSLDGHVRLWNIPDKRVVYWSLVPIQASPQIPVAQTNLITAVNFVDDGRKVTVGTFDGRFLLYSDSLQYETVMNIGEKDASRTHRSRKKRAKPHKITGIEALNLDHSKVLITSNDSRIRLYDIRTKEIEREYRGYSNPSSQIRASLSHDDRYIISGSEDSWFYIWRTEVNKSHLLTVNFSKKKQEHAGRAYERIRVYNTMVTSAIFAPNPNAIMNYLYSSMISSPIGTPNVNSRTRSLTGNGMTLHSNDGSIYVMVTADSKGQLKILVNRFHRSM